MIRWDQIPKEVLIALRDANGSVVSAKAIAAALNAWPGWTQGTQVIWLSREGSHEVDSIILPLSQPRTGEYAS